MAARYRTSCDSCQNSKVRCSQDKPSCKRCTRLGNQCLYTPIRRMGRPRKTDDGLAPASSDPEARIVSDKPQKPVQSLSPAPTSNSTSGTALETYPLLHRGTLGSPLQDSTIYAGLQDATDSRSQDCYMTILQQTAELEQHILGSKGLPTVDLVVEAESNLRAVKREVFHCTGHRQTGRAACSSAPDRPVFLSLTLLAERIVSLFEEVFQQAATATAGSEIPEMMAHRAGGRLARFHRRRHAKRTHTLSASAMGIKLLVGDYELSEVARVDAIMQLFQLRVQRILTLLQQIRDAVLTRLERREFEANSAVIMADSAVLLCRHLITRAELLQGSLAARI